MAEITDLERGFIDVVELCFQIESVPSHPQLTRRLAVAWRRSVEKAFVVAWRDSVDPEATNPSVLRAAEHGARDFLS